MLASYTYMLWTVNNHVIMSHSIRPTCLIRLLINRTPIVDWYVVWCGSKTRFRWEPRQSLSSDAMLIHSPQGVPTSPGHCVCHSIHQLRVQTCRFNQIIRAFLYRRSLEPPLHKTQNVFILLIKVATLVGDMAGWQSRQTIGLNNALDKVKD